MALTPFCRDWVEGLGPLSRVLVVLLYAFVPVTVSFLCLWRTVPAWKPSAGMAHPRKGEKRKARVAHVSRPAFLAYGRRLVLPAVPVAVLIVGLYGSYDKIRSQIVAMNALAQRGRWPEVLQHAGRLPENVYSIYANHDIDRALDHGFEPAEAACIRRINSYIRRQEGGRLNQESIEEMLTGLLERSPSNRMAFEYLMACYLLAGSVDKLAVSRKTLERYERFVQLDNSLRAYNREGEPGPALQQLVREFGTSYFFYYRFTILSPAPNP